MLAHHLTVLLTVLSFAAAGSRSAIGQSPASPCSSESRAPWTVETADPNLLDGVRAVEESRFDAADSLFRIGARSRKSEAEAYYLLARLNMDEHVDDPAAASRYLRRALELEPKNVRLMQERLAQVNSGKSFFMGSDADTGHWAGRILSVDSTDATTLTFLGADDLDRYYHYNRLMNSQPNGVLDGMRADALDIAQDHLYKALSIDPCQRNAYLQLIRLYFLTKIYSRIGALASGMQRYFPSDPQGWLFEGAAAFFDGHPDEARSSFETAFTQMDYAERSRFRLHSYFLNDEQRLAAARDTDYLRRFWEALRPRYLTDVNERLIAHYARLVFADLFFPYWRAYVDDPWMITPGEVVLRWGLPVGNFTNFNDGEALTLTFREAGSVQFSSETRNGEFFVTDVAMFPEGMGTEDESALPPPSTVMAARDQIHFTPQTYTPPGNARSVDIPYLVSALKPLEGARNGEADVVIALGLPISPTDTNIPALGRPLDASNRAILDQLYLATGSFLIDESTEVVAEKRQTYYGLPERGLMLTIGGTLWTTTHTYLVAPGSYRVSVEFETLSKDVVGATQAWIDVPSFSSDSLMLSDLVMAYSVDETAGATSPSSNHLRRSGLDILPAPWAVYGVNQPIYVYFEMYNLTQDLGGATSAEIDVALVPADHPGGVAGFVQRLFAGQEEGVAVRSSFSGSRGDDGQYLIVDASSQQAGEYDLVLRVRDLVSGSVRQSQRAIVLEDVNSKSSGIR